MINFSYDEDEPLWILPDETERKRGVTLNAKGHKGLTKEEFKELVYLYKKGWELIKPNNIYEIPQKYIDAWS